MDIKTWADFGALSEEDRAAYSPEELETLKTSITAYEAELAENNKKKDEELAKAKELAENYKIRAEKAEKADKKDPEKYVLQAKDILFLSKENITEEEDIDEVVRYAEYRKIGVADALKDKTLRTILSDRAEERASALAAQTKGQRGTTKVSDDALLDKLSKGEVPEPGSKEAEQLFWAKRGGQR